MMLVTGSQEGAGAPAAAWVGEEEKAGAPKPKEWGAGWDHQAPSQEEESGDGAGGCGEDIKHHATNHYISSRLIMCETKHIKLNSTFL